MVLYRAFEKSSDEPLGHLDGDEPLWGSEPLVANNDKSAPHNAS